MSNLKDRDGTIFGTMKAERVFENRGKYSLFVDRKRVS